MQYPFLLMVRGLPGSGKSYLADAIRTRLGEANVVILDPDKIDFESQDYKQLTDELRAKGVEEKFYPNRYLKSVGYKAIAAGKAVIWNQAFTHLEGFNRSKSSLHEFADEHNIPLPELVVEVEVSQDVAKSRVAQRAAGGGHDVDEHNFSRFIGDYQSFEGNGYNLIKIDGNADINASVDTVLRALERIS